MRLSYSRLLAYLQCGEYYRHYYVARTPVQFPLEEALVQGTLAHAGLELVLRQPERAREEVIAEVLGPWLIRDCQLDVTGVDVAALTEFALAFGRLIYRTSGRYRGEYGEPIRNRDGSVPRDLLNYPPSSWGQALRERPELCQLRLQWDNWAGQGQPLFKRVSFSYLVGRVVDWILHFRYPEDYDRTLLVEYEFSPEEENEDQVYVTEDCRLNGKIDWVYANRAGEIVVCDHKTSSQPPSQSDVAHSPQLVLYAYAVRQVFGVWPHHLAIHHVPTGRFLVMPLDVGVADQVLAYVQQAWGEIAKGVYRRRLPTEYATPCIKRDYRTGVVVNRCPYLAHCWPKYYELLSLEGIADDGVE